MVEQKDYSVVLRKRSSAVALLLPTDDRNIVPSATRAVHDDRPLTSYQNHGTSGQVRIRCGLCSKGPLL